MVSQQEVATPDTTPVTPPGGRARFITRLRATPRSDLLQWFAWVAFALGGMIWVATWYRDHWYFYDEWTTIDRSTGSWSDAFDGHQGHLEVLSFIVYRLQRTWFGLEGHQLVWLAFMASLAALQLSIAAVLRRLGLATLLALLSATVVTYFGPGAQGATWEFMLGINFALALCFLAGFVALRDSKHQRGAVTIAILLVASVACDSGLAVFGAVFVGILVVLRWPWRLAVAALAPPLIAHVAWFAFGDQGVQISASMDKMITFASRLFFYSAGGLVGGGETRSVVELVPSSPTIPLDGAWVGAIVLLLAGICVGFGFARHRLDRKVTVTLIAGSAAAVFGVASLAKGRAFLIAPSTLPGSRYVQWIAIFLLVALAPAIAATLHPLARRSRLVPAVAAAGLAAIFVVNLGQFAPVRRFNEDWGAQVKHAVAQSVTILHDGCGEGRRPNPRAVPEANLAPQITIRVVQEALDDGSLAARFGMPPTPATRRLVCRPIGARGTG